LARQKECQILEGHLLPDHVHMCIAIPPKYPVASVIGFLKVLERIVTLDEAAHKSKGFYLSLSRCDGWTHIVEGWVNS